MEQNTVFQINDIVVHCREGLSTVVSITTMGDKQYYLVKTHRNGEDTIYVPVESSNNIIRNVMTSKEADQLLAFMKTIQKDFNPNTKQRRDAYKRALISGDIKEIAYLSRSLFFFNNAEEIKLGAVDLEMLTYAHNMLLDELALSYNTKRELIEELVNSKIENM